MDISSISIQTIGIFVAGIAVGGVVALYLDNVPITLVLAIALVVMVVAHWFDTRST